MKALTKAKLSALISNADTGKGYVDAGRKIIAMPLEERGELRALVWLGRADAGEKAEDWDELVDEATAQSAADGAGGDADYLAGKGHLAKYLQAGLEKLEAAGYVIR